MTVLAEVVNDNSISAYSIALFGTMLTAISATIVGIYQVRHRTDETKTVALEAKAEAQKAKSNTENISNGFASNVDRKLNRIIEQQLSTDNALREHLEWHLSERNKR